MSPLAHPILKAVTSLLARAGLGRVSRPLGLFAAAIPRTLITSTALPFLVEVSSARTEFSAMNLRSLRLRTAVKKRSVERCYRCNLNCVCWKHIKFRLKTSVALATLAVTLLTPFSAEAKENRLIDPHVSQSNITRTICDAQYLNRVTPSFDSQVQRKKQLLQELGIDPAHATMYAFEFRIPILLGGVPDLARNVDLRGWDGPAGARRKRRLTVVLRHCVCAGKLPLHRAQETISGNWSVRFTHLWGLSCQDF